MTSGTRALTVFVSRLGMSRRAFAPLARALADASRALHRDGVAVIDDALDASAARELAREMRALFASERGFERNSTVFARAGERFLLEKRGVYEREAHTMTDAQRALAPTFACMANDAPLLGPLNDALGFVGDSTLERASVKLQVSEGGAFPLHFDSDATLDSRRLTALCYLGVGDGDDEVRDWRSGDGGELVFLPFPRPRSQIEVEPRLGRVVLFSSEFGLHRVLPSRAARRYMFTCWYFARAKRPTEAAPPPGTDAESQMAALLHPSLRKHVAKIVLANEWADSIEQAHEESESRAAALQTHWDEVELITRVFANNYPLGLERIATELARGDKGAFADIEFFPTY